MDLPIEEEDDSVRQPTDGESVPAAELFVDIFGCRGIIMTLVTTETVLSISVLFRDIIVRKFPVFIAFFETLQWQCAVHDDPLRALAQPVSRVVDVRRLELASIEAEAHLEDVAVYRSRIYGIDAGSVGDLVATDIGLVGDALESDREGGVLRVS